MWRGLDCGVRPSGSKVELYAAIRRDARAGKSARAIQREYRVSWTTVHKALGSALSLIHISAQATTYGQADFRSAA